MELEQIAFSCDEKCRICPYPGANCKRASAKAVTVRQGDEHRIWMSRELQDELIRRMHILHK